MQSGAVGSDFPHRQGLHTSTKTAEELRKSEKPTGRPNTNEQKMKWSKVLSAAALAAVVCGAAHSGTTPKILLLDESDGDLSGAEKGLPTDTLLMVQETEEEVPESHASLFYMAVLMIVVSEIGDKTFLIAALMAMKNSKLVVFTLAFASLAVMTVLLGVVGHALPTLISQRMTQFLASGLFLVFGVRLLREGLAMDKEAGVDEELAEVEEEIALSNMNENMADLEGGKSKETGAAAQIKDLLSFVLSPVWIQVFVMTFLGEWGDRSQIATIAMAAGSDYWFVIFGAVIGHALCTAAACVGGQLLASRISMRTVTIGGSIAFFVFAVMYFYDFYTS